MAGIRALLWALGASALYAQQPVSFPARDGVVIYGDLYGNGDRGLVLAHGGRFDKAGWAPQAARFTAAGFRCLAIDYRGEGRSRAGAGDVDEARPLDILAAIHYLRGAGARSVFVIGASMGGDYAADAAEMEPAAIDRLVMLGAGAYTPLLKSKGPKLFILAREDSDGAGLRLPKIRMQYEKAREPKKLVILEGSAHAQFLFATDQGERLMREILEFLSAP
jgi:pimeloyl-ACP methyl ester carboxylesterase